MNHFTSYKTLALAALLAQAGSVMAKPATPSYGNLAISKIFFAGDKRTDSQTPKNVLLSNYIEIVNNSADEVLLAGLMIGLTDTENPSTNGWTVANLEAAGYSGKIALKQVFQIPTDNERILKPGETIVVCNSAQDYSEVLEHGIDLSTADYEVKSENTPNQMSGAGTHNDNVPALNCVYTYIENTDYMNFSMSGPCGVVLLPSNTDIANATKVYRPGKESGQQYVLVDAWRTVDAIDIVKNGQGEADKRIDSGSSYDQGYAVFPVTTTYSGQVAYRKTAWKKGDVLRVFDTNNSTVDIAFSTTIKPREFPEAVGLTESAVVVPETGIVAINPEKPFALAEEGLTLVSLNSSTKTGTTDLTYTTFAADSILFINGPWILVGKPGEHKLLLSESQGVMKSRTSIFDWTDEAQVDQTTGNKKSRYIYKFVNTADKVGFQRDENYASITYPYAMCDFAEGEHLFFALATKNLGMIAEANGATGYEDLSFVQWHGPVYDPTAAGISQQRPATAACRTLYDLSGRRVAQPVKGIYVQNGKKIVVK